MGILYRYDHIEEGLSVPLILSFRLTIEIPDELCGQLQEHLAHDEPPSSCFLSQLYTKKMGDSYFWVIKVNLLSFYEKWSENFDYSYRNIINLLREKICGRLGRQFTEHFIRHENLDCDFIEYSFIARGRDVIRDMQECRDSWKQVSKTHWEDYLEEDKKRWTSEKKEYSSDEGEYVNFLPCCIEYNYSDYAKNVDTNSLESYNSCNNDFYECYVRCNGDQLQKFIKLFGKNDYIGKRGVFLKYLFDDNFKQTLCQCAYQENCMRRVYTGKTARLLYEEFCKEFGNLLEGQSLAQDDYIELDDR